MKVNYYDLNKDYYFYLNKNLFFKKSKDNRLKNKLFTFIPMDIDLDDLLKSKILIKEFIKGYYYPKFDKLKSCKNKKININEQALRYTNVNKYGFKLTKVKTKLYQNYNMIYDMTPYFNLFKEVYFVSGNYSFNNFKVSLFNKFLEEIFSKLLATYPDVYLIHFPTHKIENGRDFSFENILYYLLLNDELNKSLFSKINFIYADKLNRRLFKFNISNINLSKYKKLTNILVKLSNNESLTEEEKQELEINSESEVQNEKEIIESNSKINVKLRSKNKNLEELHIDPDEEKDKVVSKINPIDNKNIKVNNLNKKKVNTINDAGKKLKDKLSIGLNLDNKENYSNAEIELMDKINSKIDSKVKEYKDKNENADNEEFDPKELEKSLNNDKEFVNLVSELSDYQVNNPNTINDKKRKTLEDKQSKVSLDDKTIDDVINELNTLKLDTEEINIKTSNEEIKKSNLKDFDRSYNKNKLEIDFLRNLTSFDTNPDCQIYLTKLTKKDTSDSFNKKMTYEMTFEDTWDNKHNVKLDVPIIIDDSFIYINDNKKTIGKQLILLPVTKTAPDEVRLTSTKKLFITRYGRKVNSNIDRLKKFLAESTVKSDKNIEILYGNNTGINSKYLSTIEYDEISTFLIKLIIKKDLMLTFNRETCEEDVLNVFDTNDIESDDKKFLIGCCKSSNSLFYINLKEGRVEEFVNKKLVRDYGSVFDLFSIAIKELNEEYYTILTNEKVSNKFMYTRVKIVGKPIPLGILMGFYFGLENVLKAYNIEYHIVENGKGSRSLISQYDKLKYNFINLKDSVLIYQNKVCNEILLNGFSEMLLKEINFEELNTQKPYLDYFDLAFGSRNFAKGFKNAMDFFLDPKTKEVLRSQKLPDDLMHVLLYANTLLEDNSYTKIADMSNYRLRSTEMINSYIYEIMSQAIRDYQDYYKMGHSEARISIPQDTLIKQLVTANTVEEYSILNPVLEVEKMGSASYRGLGGTNMDYAFTPDMRTYDKSMVGLLSLSTPDSNKVGVVRQLSYNCKVKNNLGIIDTNTDIDKLEATDMFTAGELLNSYTSIHADPPKKLGNSLVIMSV